MKAEAEAKKARAEVRKAEDKLARLSDLLESAAMVVGVAVDHDTGKRLLARTRRIRAGRK